MFDHTTVSQLQAERTRQIASRMGPSHGEGFVASVLRSLRLRRDRPELDPAPSGLGALRPS